MFVLNSMGAMIAPWGMAYSHMEDVTKDEKALRDAYNVGYLVVETIKALKSYDKRIGYDEDVSVEELVKIANHVVNNNDKMRRLEELAKLVVLKT